MLDRKCTALCTLGFNEYYTIYSMCTPQSPVYFAEIPVKERVFCGLAQVLLKSSSVPNRRKGPEFMMKIKEQFVNIRNC